MPEIINDKPENNPPLIDFLFFYAESSREAIFSVIVAVDFLPRLFDLVTEAGIGENSLIVLAVALTDEVRLIRLFFEDFACCNEREASVIFSPRLSFHLITFP